MIPDQSHAGHPAGSAAVLGLALAFFLAGCALLVTHGATLPALHAFAAFIVLAIVAALDQLVPVLTGAPPASPLIVTAFGIAFAAGFGLLVTAFLGTGTFASAAVALGATAVAWVGWTVSRLMRAVLEREIACVLGGATAAFGLAAALGAGMALELAGHVRGMLILARVHGTLAIAAFASVTIVAVSYRLVPMFALAHVSPRRWERLPAAAILVCASAATSPPFGARLAFAAMLAMMALAARTHLVSLRGRMRRRLDVSLRYAFAAWFFAFAAAGLALAATWIPGAARPAVVCAVLGWLSVSVLGYAYKIAGFLLWQIAKERHPGAALTPLSAAVPERPTTIALVLLVLGAAGAVCTDGLAAPYARLSFALYALGGLIAVATCARLGLLFLKGRACPTPFASTTADSLRPNR